MNAQQLLEEFHVFARPGFLSKAECASLRRSADNSRQSAAQRYDNESGKNTANENTSTASVPASAAERLDQQLQQIKPALEKHFALALSGWDTPTVFVYESGAELKPHKDVHPGTPTREPKEVRRRKVSVVVFLNTESASPGPEQFGGGHLRLYDLPASPDAKPRAVGLRPRNGLLVAFDSSLPHEVTRVVEGTRYCLITWFY